MAAEKPANANIEKLRKIKKNNYDNQLYKQMPKKDMNPLLKEYKKILTPEEYLKKRQQLWRDENILQTKKKDAN